MTALRYGILLLVGITILTSCALRAGKDQPVEQPLQSAGEQLLIKGIGSYEDGEYKSAAKYFEGALNAGLTRMDSAIAHKYLAFVACGLDNTRRCRDEFRKAFEDNPSFTLGAAEAGHPVWGPIYRRVRDQIRSKEKPR